MDIYGIDLAEGTEIKNMSVATGTETERLALSSPNDGELFYQTNGTKGLYLYSTGAWVRLTITSDIGTLVQGYDADLATIATNGIGTGANQIVQLDGSAKLPAVDGSNLTNLPSGSGGNGKVLQVKTFTVQTSASSTGTFPQDNTNPEITEGWELLSGTITPISSSSTLHISMTANIAASATKLVFCGVFKAGVTNCLFGTAKYINTNAGTFAAQGSIASGSTSAQTFSLRAGGSSGTTYRNKPNAVDYYNSTIATTLTITEVGA